MLPLLRAARWPTLPALSDLPCTRFWLAALPFDRCGAQSRARCCAHTANAKQQFTRHACPLPLLPQPSSAGTQLSRDALLLKLLLRRAAAYVELGRMEDALAEYEEAHELAPENGAVKDALRQLRARA